MSNRIYLIVGPSGVGKNTLLDGLLASIPNAQSAVSVTTRNPRPGETHGVNYFYITRQEFEAHIHSKDFLQWVEYAGNYYGLLTSEVDIKLRWGHVFCVVEPEGARQLKAIYPEAKVVYLHATRSLVENRMRDRGDTATAIEGRMATYGHFSSFRDEADYVIEEIEADKVLAEAAWIVYEQNSILGP